MHCSVTILMTAVTATACLMTGCAGRASSGATDDAEQAVWPDTLRVGTIYSPGGYFIYRDQEMGYDYTLADRLCRDKGMTMKLTVAPSLPALINMLRNDSIDLIAFEVPVTGDFKDKVLHCGPVNETSQVLVQPGGTAAITDVTQLPGNTVWVELGSKYESRIRHLNDEVGGGIDIRTIKSDTLITEELVDMVSDGSIPMTIVDSDIAQVSRTYYPDIDVSVSVSLPQRSAWGVAPGRKALADSIDAWFGADATRSANTELLRRYYEMSKREPSALSVDLSKGRISPYDDLFRKYAGQIGWDWRLLASIGWVESGFDPTLVSWAGARGLMQIMPVAAEAYGSSAEAVSDPETAIRVGCKIVASLDKSLKNEIPDDNERRKFVLAAYNGGIAHIRDAIAIARHIGHDPTVWHGSVAEAMMLKSQPEYYNMPQCRYGYFRGRQTYDFVNKVMDFYERTKRFVPI